MDCRTDILLLRTETKQIKMTNCQRIKMCIVHKGFRGFRAVSPASFFGGNLIDLKPAIPYETIHLEPVLN